MPAIAHHPSAPSDGPSSGLFEGSPGRTVLFMLLCQPAANLQDLLIAHPAKRLQPLVLGATGARRVREPPVHALRRKRENWAVFVRVVTDRDHIMPHVSQE